MLDLLIIQHEKDTPAGTVIQWAQEHKLQYHIWNISEKPQEFKPEDAKALIICGGTMDTFQEDQFPWLKNEKEFICQFIKLEKPIFGLCLGSQLLAEVLGGRVYPYKKWEIGFVPVQVNEVIINGKSMKSQILQVFHWHQCTFDLPPGSTRLATNDFCANQAFTFGKNIIATQFHPESTVEWITECAKEADSGSYQGLVQNQKEILENIGLQKTLQDWFFKMLDAWYSPSILSE